MFYHESNVNFLRNYTQWKSVGLKLKIAPALQLLVNSKYNNNVNRNLEQDSKAILNDAVKYIL